MELTGKCKEDFDKWFRKSVPFVDINIFNHRTTPSSMQYGVYVDFFDSVGIVIEITNDYKEIPTFWVDINNKQVDFETELNTRPEARIEAIQKANELYNN